MLIHRTPTEKQIAAARANGRKSRGPITPQGKFNSATAHHNNGILARTVVLQGESSEKFKQLLDALYAELLPESPIEIQLVESMAVARWRQMRLWALEKATIVAELSKTNPTVPGPAAGHTLDRGAGPAADPSAPPLSPASAEDTAGASAGDRDIDRTAEACQSLVNGSHWTEHMSRSEARHDRLYARAMALFRKHRAWRREEIKNAPVNPALD